jgi:MtN3 and saliva related transmembrane protein
MEDWLPLGLAAGFLTTLGFVPQILKGLRTKKLDEVSLLMPILLSLGMFLWLLYGVVKGDLPIIIWNAIALSLNMALVGLLVFYGRKHRHTTPRAVDDGKDLPL